MCTRPLFPSHWLCKSCGWKKTVSPRSDARVIGTDCFIRCPRCGSEVLEENTDNADGSRVGWLDTLFGRRPTKLDR